MQFMHVLVSYQPVGIGGCPLPLGYAPYLTVADPLNMGVKFEVRSCNCSESIDTKQQKIHDVVTKKAVALISFGLYKIF